VTLRLRVDRLEWLETDGEVIALDGESLLYLSANPSASVLWQELAAGATREQLIGCLVDRFGIEDDTAAADVDGFVAGLRSRGLLER
jgi:hypothetical protein